MQQNTSAQDTKALWQLAAIVDSSDDAIIGKTLEGIITSWNDGAVKLYGYPTNEVIGKSVSILVPADRLDEIPGVLARIKQGEKIARFETVRVKKDGKPIIVSLTVSPIKDNKGNIVGASTIARDITERKQIEQALQISETKYRDLYENAPVAYYSVGLDYLVKGSNRAAQLLFGYSDEELVGKPNIELYEPECAAKMRIGTHHHKFEQGIPLENEERVFQRKDGSKIYALLSANPVFDEAGHVVDSRMVVRDITEFRKTQEQMREANEKLNILVQKFEKQNQMNSILTEMRDLLQSCSTIKETVPIIVSTVTKLFPKTNGALFLMSPSRTDLESVAQWGNFPEDVEENVFAPEACWGLRRGRPHLVLNNNASPICSHIKNAANISYVCLPLIAKGDVLGLLHLRIDLSATEKEKQTLVADFKDAAVNISEFLSLAMANIKLSEILQTQSIRDALSGLFNRRYMEETIQREIQRAIRKRSSIGIVMADIDHFKKFNDTYGHAAGDMCMSQIGKLFQQRIRASDIACRYGGEEFVLIFPDSSLEDTFKRAEILRQAVKGVELMFQGQFIGPITISMGVAAFPIHGNNMVDLLRAADTSLYKAKQEGRDRVIVG